MVKTRAPLIAGNWKMNKTAAEAEQFLRQLLARAWPQDRELLICAPFTHLPILKPYTEANRAVALGAQDVFWEEAGAFTGEISAAMLLEAGCDYVLVGHSERRQWFAESDAAVNRKALAAVRAGLIPICCIGEDQAQRDQGQAETVVRAQLERALQGVEALAPLVIAYEPVWAIGTGRGATPQDAQDMAAWIRRCLETVLPGRSEAVRILYGGSVKPDIMRELMAMPDVDGVLVGGASLDADVFGKIAGFAI
jgi:triosephosphate isomerase